MSVIETGDCRLSLTVDYFGSGSPGYFQFFIASNQQDLITLDSHQLSAGRLGFHSEHISVFENKIGNWHFRLFDQVTMQ